MASPFKYLEMHGGDTALARRFYTELFGWTTEDHPMPDGGTYTLLKAGGDGLGGIMPSKHPAQWIGYVIVPDAAAATKRARALGATIEIDCQPIPGMGVMSLFADPNGARCGIWEDAEK
jgi:predicted enzyme related to lactoylglutathione lyase